MTVWQDIQSLGDVLYQLAFIFPYTAYTTPYRRTISLPSDESSSSQSQSPTPATSSPNQETMGPDKDAAVNGTAETFSDKTFSYCTSKESVSALLAADPTLAPGDAWRKLYGHHVPKLSSSKSMKDCGKGEVSQENLGRAEQCGKFGPTQPSDLFLRLYHDALCTLHDNPQRAMVSPSLMGSCGVVPLTIISVIPDIVRHMGNVIVRAEKEVFLATNYWQNSHASKFITNAMRELSRRAGERGEKVVMKIIYDRGSVKQLIEPHYIVPEKEYTGKDVGLPYPHEIPNIDLEVMNYHHPMLGTFHAKYMVVDRKVGILQSNNIQDNDNVEMMIHLEGPIVDSLYDMALLSWNKKLTPPLPSYNSPAAQGGIGSFGDKHDGIFGPDGTIKGHKAIIDPTKMRQRQAFGSQQTKVQEPGAVDAADGEQHSTNPDRADPLTGPTTTTSTLHPHEPSAASGASNDVKFATSSSVRATQGPSNPPLSQNTAVGPDAETQDFLAGGTQPLSQLQIKDPVGIDTPFPEDTADDPQFDNDIADEVARVQALVSAKPGETQMEAISRHLNHTTNVGFRSDAPDFAAEDEMTPCIPHRAHEPFPIAMVCRSPYGPPNHMSVEMPQNAAWLSALRNARKNVFIQSPTLNAEPLLPAIVEACERGVDVYCYICLGYNDMGELLPMQGGHNELIAHTLYKTLSEQGRQRLHYFWYVGKDQARPIVQEKRRRSCHIKLMIVDERVAIQGNGNQDTQSWFHSQEVNVMLESADVCAAWIDGLRRNQNTHLYGQLSRTDGVWRDAAGKEADGATGVDPGRFSWARGILGAVKRVQGTGGF